MNKKTAYSSLKYVHMMDDINKLKNGEIIPPKFVIIYPVNYCNHSCGFCAYRKTKLDEGYLAKSVNIKDMISSDLLLDIPRQLSEAGVKGIEISGGGEPTLHPKFKEFVQEINKYNLDGALVTNGSLLDDETIELIKDFSWIRISINGGYNSYSKIQDPSPNPKYLQLDDIWNQIRKLCQVKSKKTIVGISFVISRHYSLNEESGTLDTITNVKDIYEVGYLSAISGADNVRYSLAFSKNGTDTYDDIWEYASEQMEKVKISCESNDFTVFTLASNRVNDKNINKNDKKDYNICNYINFSTVINAEGNIMPCCVQSYNNNLSVGSLYEKEFIDIWNSEDRMKLYKNIDVNNGLCKTNCFMNEKNKLLEYLLEKEPIHLSFP